MSGFTGPFAGLSRILLPEPDVMALDAHIWRTAKNGKRFQIDTETGEIVKGNVGQKPKGEPYQSSPMDSTAPDMGRFRALVKAQGGDHKKAAHEYFREKLQGRHVDSWTPEGNIRATFTGGSWQEIKKDMSEDPIKAELVPHMPDIIATGEYESQAPAHAHPDVTQFHTYRKIVPTIAGPKEAIVDVAERPARDPKNMVYSLTREGTKPFSDREKHTKKAADSAQVSFGPLPNHEERNPSPSGNRIASLSVSVNLTREGTKNYEKRNKESSASGSGQYRMPAEDSLNEDTIRPQFEVVNLRVEDMPSGPFSGPFKGLNRISIPGTEWTR